MKNIYYLTASKKRLLLMQKYLQPLGYNVYPTASEWKKDFATINQLVMRTIFFEEEDVEREIKRLDHKNIWEPKLFEVRKIFERASPDLYIIDLRLSRSIGYYGQHYYSCLRRAVYEYVVPTMENKDPVLYLRQYLIDPILTHPKMRSVDFEYGDTLKAIGKKIERKINELFKQHTLFHRLLHHDN